MTADITAVTYRAAGGSKSRPVHGIQIGETRHRPVELQFDRAGRPMALLADDHFGLTLDPISLGLPFLKLLTVRLEWLAHRMIIFLTEYEEHHVGVLFDR